MRSLPQGTVTFLFSDVEGSTRLAEMLGDEHWAGALETHRRLVRQAVVKHGGVEIDTQGDSFFIAFPRASDAICAALDTQRAMSESAWPLDTHVLLRIGIHTGEALVSDNHYVGKEVHRASRICNAGHGGQIVVSWTTAELVRFRLPHGSHLDDLGEHRLKDFPQSQRLFQLLAPNLKAQFPRLRSLNDLTNLPGERSSFVGREAELTTIRSALADHRLITLTGIGGSVKTRLALQVAAGELRSYP